MARVAPLFQVLFLILSTFSLLATPGNDHFSDRVALFGEELTVRGAITGATVETNEPNTFGWTVPWNGTKQSIW